MPSFLVASPFRAFVAICLVVLALHDIYFVVLPWLLTRRATRSPRLRRYLERVVATPSLLGDRVRVRARHDLMRLSHMEGLHEQAAAQGAAILRHRDLATITAVEVRGRLADALEGLGRHDEAREQRRLAEEGLKGTNRDPAWYINRGRQLDARRDFVGACRAFEQGLEIAPPGVNDARALLVLHLANALYMAGRVEDSARRAAEAARLVDDPEGQYAAHRQAGASNASLGRLAEAEVHRQRAVALAETMGDARRLVDSVADLAEIQRKRGQLAEAFAACDRAARASRPTRHLELIRYEILRSWGQFDEALAALWRASRIDPLPTVRAEELTQGIFAFGRATVLMEHGRLDEVPALLESTRRRVRGDAKIGLWCDAAAVRLAALCGRSDEVLDTLDQIEARLAEFAQDTNTRGGVLASLGRAALAVGAYDRALVYWEQYRALPPSPVELPVALYHLGEVHKGLGDPSTARSCYRAAVDTGLDTHYTRLARHRLSSILD
jgi:tetratricopeptide (TPR) repeat protein